MPEKSSAPANGVPADVQDEMARLRETVRQVEAERDEYKTALYSLLRARVNEQEVVLPDEKDCLTFDQFVPELEEMVDKAQPGLSR
jgi:hypothetical protein